MILADDEVSEKETRMIRRFAIEAGFNDSKIDGLMKILLDGVKNNTGEEELFRKFREYILS